MGGGHHRDAGDPVNAARWLARTDPRARLLGAVAVAVALACTRSVEGAAVGVWLGFALLYVGGVPIAYLLQRLRLLLVLLVPLALLVPLSRPEGAAPIWAAWPGGPTDLGAQAALRIALRVLGVSLLALLAFGVGSFDRTARALARLGLPRRLVHVLLLTYRYLFTLGEELDRVRMALAARGFRARPDRATLETFGQAAGALLLRSLRRAERIDQAMRCRGFRGELQGPPEPAFRRRDAALLGVAGALAAAIVWWDTWGRLL